MVRHLPPYSPILYLGFDYARASRRAEEVCRIAGDTGQTIRASEHLSALVAIMERSVGQIVHEPA